MRHLLTRRRARPVDDNASGGVTSASEHLGALVRRVRRDAELTVAELSAKAGVSSGMISQIERGQANPSIKVLQKLGAALNIPVATLLEDAEPPPQRKRSDVVLPENTHIRRLVDRPKFQVGPAPLAKELVSPPGKTRMQMMTIRMPPHSRSEEVVTSPGEKAGFVIGGVLTLIVGENAAELREGDSFQFDSTQPHEIQNRTDQPVDLFWIILLDTPTFI